MVDAGKAIKQELSQDKETAKRWLLNYDGRRRQYFEAQKSRSKSPFNMSMAEAGRWLKVVELVQGTLSENRLLFLRLRRQANRDKGIVNWVPFVQQAYAGIMAEKHGGKEASFWMSEGTLYKWWGDMVEEARLIAYKKQCKF